MLGSISPLVHCCSLHPKLRSETRKPSSVGFASGVVPGDVGRCRNASSGSFRSLRARAAGDNPDAIPISMTKEEARAILGVSETTRFDEILAAKNKLKKVAADPKRIEEIETAYDLLFMSSMRARISGEKKVSDKILFADVKRAPRKQPGVIQELPAGVVLENPSSNILLTNSLVFVPLASWALLQGLAAPELPSDYDFVPSLPLALAVGWSVYSFREFKIQGLGKAAAYTVAGLVVGAIVGGLIQSGVRIDQHPIGAFSSPATFVSEFVFISLWAFTTFLK
ncbi:hypothetical protein BSKO_12909 [Bryopsis sp. KO-2023]|nr:hypothetical protein BSKO_12909 [Bryopsis sp. KO-2023]